jgi:hypothetical protein
MNTNEIPFNGIKLRKLLQTTMIELKQFHLYVKLYQYEYCSTDLSSTNSQLTDILNKRIQRLNIEQSSALEKLTEINYVYF